MRWVTLKRLLLPTACALSVFVGSGIAANAQNKLSAQGQKVVDYLVTDWGQDSVTSVDMAMDALKVEQSDETRFRIGSYIKAHPELHAVIRRWGWVTLVLTPEEKLIARSLINAQRDGKAAPGIAEIAKAVGIAEPQVTRGLAMLDRYEIIKRESSIAGAGYSVMPLYVRWVPRLDFVFHKVTLDSGRQFNTN